MFRRLDLRAQRGQTAAEWLGIMLVVAAIILAVSATPLGTKVADGLNAAICRITGGSCEPEDGNYEAGIPPLNECVRGSSQRGLEGEVKVFFITVGGEVKGKKEVFADGSVRVTFEGNADVGLEFGSPGAEVEGGGAEGGGGAEVEVSAGGGAAYAWDFENEDDANDFVDDVEKKTIAILDPTPNMPFTDDDADIELPDPTRRTYQGGVEVNASGDAGAVGLDGAISGKGGVTYNDKTGEKTVFLELSGSGSANGGPFGGGFAGSGRVAITYDKDGNASSARFIGTADVTANFGLSADDLKSGNLEEVLDEASKDATKFKVDGGAGARAVFDANLALGPDHPENQAALDAFLNGQAGSGADLLGRFNDDAVMNTRLYSLEKSKTGGGVDGTVFGAEGYYSTEDADLLNAWYRNKTDGGWTQWEDCVQGLAD